MMIKINFVDKVNGEFVTESLWATKVEGGYKIDNIPFLVGSIALWDIVSIEIDKDNGLFYFKDLIKESGHSVIQIKLFDRSKFLELTNFLECKGCDWEELKQRNIIAVDIPTKDILKEITP